jgi:hypothetical protein
MKRSSKKLSLQAETLRSLTPTELGEANGAGVGVVTRTIVVRPPIVIRTVACPSLVDGCPTSTLPDTSIVINPGPIFGR